MATSTIKVNEANQVHNATLSSGVTGFCSYVQNGRMVTITGVLSTTSAKAAGATLATGLPRPVGGYTIGNFQTFGADIILRVGDGGQLISGSAIASGTSNFRFAYSYVSI